LHAKKSRTGCASGPSKFSASPHSFEYRFELTRSSWLDAKLQPCEQNQAAFMRVTLRKIATTPRERTVARTMRADFGGLESDELFADDAQALA